MNIMKRLGKLVAPVTLALSLVSTAQGVVIFSNFGAGDSFSNTGLLLQGPAVGTIADVNQAAQFTVPAGDYALTQVELGLSINGTGPLNIILAADGGGLPGATLVSAIVNVGAAGQQIVSSALAPILLSGGTSYWVIADGEGALNGGWNFNNIGEIGLTAGQELRKGSNFALCNHCKWNLARG
jgi:hypothetical protein